MNDRFTGVKLALGLLLDISLLVVVGYFGLNELDLKTVIHSRNEYVTGYKNATAVSVKGKNVGHQQEQLMQVASPLRLSLARAEVVRSQIDEMDRDLQRSAVKYAQARERTIFLIAL